MPPEKLEVVSEWLKKCLRDLRSARKLLEGNSPLTDSAAFFAQQIVEKALKALLTWHGIKFKKTHDLGRLGEQVLTLAPDMESLLAKATELTPFATVLRYPSEQTEPSLEEAKDALNLAIEVYGAVLKRLPLEVQNLRKME